MNEINFLHKNYFMSLYEKCNCELCKKEITKLEMFTGNICKECFSKKFDEMSVEEQVKLLEIKLK